VGRTIKSQLESIFANKIILLSPMPTLSAHVYPRETHHPHPHPTPPANFLPTGGTSSLAPPSAPPLAQCRQCTTLLPGSSVSTPQPRGTPSFLGSSAGVAQARKVAAPARQARPCHDDELQARSIVVVSTWIWVRQHVCCTADELSHLVLLRLARQWTKVLGKENRKLGGACAAWLYQEERKDL
jgi:hypothetical protein